MGQYQTRPTYASVPLSLQVVLLKSDVDELVVLDPDWLGADVIGRLFSAEAVTELLPSNGRLTMDQLRAVIPSTQPLDTVRLLATMYLCAPLHPGLVLPCLDLSEEPSLNVCSRLHLRNKVNCCRAGFLRLPVRLSVCPSVCPISPATSGTEHRAGSSVSGSL